MKKLKILGGRYYLEDQPVYFVNSIDTYILLKEINRSADNKNVTKTYYLYNKETEVLEPAENYAVDWAKLVKDKIEERDNKKEKEKKVKPDSRRGE